MYLNVLIVYLNIFQCMLSMKFCILAQLTICHRLVVSLDFWKSSSKKKRLLYPANEVVSTPYSCSSSSDVKEILDLGYIKDPFNLVILSFHC
jgi:hypothetical protein